MRRYGWHYSHIMQMPAAHFLDVVDMFNAGEKERALELYELQAFSAWQLIEFVKASINEKSKPLAFEKYLQGIGLRKQQTQTEKAAFDKAETKAALETAKSIRELDRKEAANE